MTLAKYLCVNIIEGKSVISDPNHSLQIMNGNYFRTKGFTNLVEYDYFGWINNTPYADALITVGQSIQEDLAAYDFTSISTEDLFGPLVAQLAQREQRILLGQEYTPQWLARNIVKNTLFNLPENQAPRFLDMCCGSGVFIIETIKQTIEKFGIKTHSCTHEDIGFLQQAVMGFDIDPLAVILSKVNWVLAMKEFVPYASTGIVIPVFHADSLFMITPVSKNIDRDYDNSNIELVFNEEKIVLPGFLLSTQNGILFDYLVNGCYSIAMQRASRSQSSLSKENINDFISNAMTNITHHIESDFVPTLQEFCYDLVFFLEQMQREGRNGIWAFILGNTYRPALVAAQFNGIVSNPPWMAMSKLRDNPYKLELEKRAVHYGIKPKGGAHLHIELATIFLVQAVEHYLDQNAFFGCIMPNSVLNGYQHEPFRKQNYKNAEPPVHLNVKEIWEIHPSTFKNKAVVLFGGNQLTDSDQSQIKGYHISKNNTEECEFKLLHQGKRSAWSNKPEAHDVTEVLDQIPFLQGADIMPRIVIFHRCLKQPNRKWRLSPIRRQNDDLAYLVSNAKKHRDFSLNVVNVDDRLIFKCFMSHHLTPFNVSNPSDSLLPIEKNQEGSWVAIGEEKLISMGTSVAEVFRAVLDEIGFSSHEYFEKLNYRNKLSPQKFTNEGWLVLAGAGGSYACAGYINLSNLPVEKLIVDQTLYWYVARSKEEAIYISGLLNSMALDFLIAEFQPEGLLGRRHIHKLPYAVTPKYDEENDAHQNVIEKTKKLLQEWNDTVNKNIILKLTLPSTSSISVRRRRIRMILQQLSSYNAYEEACKEVYGVELV